MAQANSEVEALLARLPDYLAREALQRELMESEKVIRRALADLTLCPSPGAAGRRVAGLRGVVAR
jgi:hypothetical protein